MATPAYSWRMEVNVLTRNAAPCGTPCGSNRRAQMSRSSKLVPCCSQTATKFPAGLLAITGWYCEVVTEWATNSGPRGQALLRSMRRSRASLVTHAARLTALDRWHRLTRMAVSRVLSAALWYGIGPRPLRGIAANPTILTATQPLILLGPPRTVTQGRVA